jgi:GAF domain-containing protein
MEKILDEFTDILNKQGLKAGLLWLNGRVPHRWTAIYRLDDVVMSNKHIVDKQNEPDLGPLAAVPVKDSFCQFAIRDGEFVKENTGTDDDARLNGHPYKGVVNSYVGLPLMLGTDNLYGTFCHFDMTDHKISDSEFQFLQRVARILPRYLDRAHA